MPDPILIITLVSILAVAFALWKAHEHGCKLDRHLPSHTHRRDPD